MKTHVLIPRAYENDGIPVDEMLKRSPASEAMLPYWDKSDALVKGHKAMKEAGTTFLPEFHGESKDAYQSRLKLTKFTNIYDDVLEALASKPFERDVILGEEDAAPPEHLVDILDNVDGAGSSLTVFAWDVFYNGINSAIDWIFIDYPDTEGAPIRTRADLKAAGIRPFWTRVRARNILDAKSEISGDAEKLTFIKIHEPGEVERVREFEYDEAGRVVWRLYKRVKGDTKAQNDVFILEKEGVLTIDVIPLVPFITGRRKGRRFQFKPPMNAAADLQIELYQQESGLKYAENLTAYPMLSGNGVKPMTDNAGKPIALQTGPNYVLYAPPNENGGGSGNWSFIEPAATSLAHLAQTIKDTKQDLRELGRQPLTATSGNLTTITTAVAAGKAKSAVKSWAGHLQKTLENAIMITCKWLAASDFKPNIDVYTDFDDLIENQGLEPLIKMNENGKLSDLTLWEESQRRGVLSEKFDPEIETERLLAQTPTETPNEENNGRPTQ